MMSFYVAQCLREKDAATLTPSKHVNIALIIDSICSNSSTFINYLFLNSLLVDDNCFVILLNTVLNNSLRYKL